MWKTNLKLAVRYMWNHKRYTVLNVLALTLGFFCFIVLSAWVGSELNFDKQYPGVYRLLQVEKDEEGKIREIASTGPQLGIAASQQFPEIEKVTQLLVMGRLTVGNNLAERQYERITAVDSNFFEIFPMSFTEGSAATVFSQPNSVVLQQRLKEKYFGKETAFQKELRTNVFQGVVGGVIENFPKDSHLDADLIVPEQTAAAAFNWWNEYKATNWVDNSFVTYFKIRPDADFQAIEQKITALAKEHWDKSEPFNSTFKLQPVSDIHLYAAEIEGEINQEKGSAFHVRMFALIALVILLVACFNYAGLVNVSFLQRAHDIGIHKTIGATRKQLLGQFLTESFMMTLASLILAIGIISLTKDGISQLMNRQFDWAMVSPMQIGIIAVATIGVVLLSTAYPAWIATRTAPVLAIRNLQPSGERWSIRRVATVVQFTMAIALLACATIFYQQMRFLKDKSLGFDLDGLVVVDINSGALRSQFQAIKQEFYRLPEVQSVSVSSRVPGEWKNYPIANVHKEGASLPKDMIFIGADEDFLKTFDIQLTVGKSFSGIPADSSTVLLNQSAVEALGLDNPIGQTVEIPVVNWSGNLENFDPAFRARVTGVVADFHFEDIRQRIKPMVIGNWKNPIHNIDYYTLKINTKDMTKTTAALAAVNNKFDPENPIELNFLDEQFQRFYENDIRRSWLLMLFSGVVIFIACLGLFAITAFAIRQRTKEIGIRKVLGASVEQIVTLISKDFVRLVLISVVLALPISWWGMNTWLDDFAYRIELKWWMFAIASLAAIVIALITVSSQAIRAAMADPVNSIKTE